MRIQCGNRGVISVKILNILEFTSCRKKMSVIFEKDGIIYVYSKGADQIIFENLCKK